MDAERINQAVGAELRAARARLDWTRQKLSEETGVSPASIQRYESGDRSVPVDVLVELMNAMDLTIIDIERAIERASTTHAMVDRTEAGRRMRAKTSQNTQH